MRLYNIALLLFCFNVSIGFVNYFNVFPDVFPQDRTWIDSFTTERLKEQEYDKNILEQAWDFGADLVKGLIYFIYIMGRTIFFVPWILNALGVPVLLNTSISAIYYFVYIVGLGQWIGNKNMSGMK
jgi:hypothetical protein